MKYIQQIRRDALKNFNMSTMGNTTLEFFITGRGKIF